MTTSFPPSTTVAGMCDASHDATHDGPAAVQNATHSATPAKGKSASKFVAIARAVAVRSVCATRL